jgi:hypothetical protein
MVCMNEKRQGEIPASFYIQVEDSDFAVIV